MTTTSVPGYRKAYRDTTAPMVGGVAAGLARHLGWSAVLVRAGFVLAAIGGIGIPLYAAYWLVLPTAERFQHDAPGLESATRAGKRPRQGGRLADAGPAIAAGALGFGLILAVSNVVGDSLFWPLMLVGAGLALLWRQADEAQRERWGAGTGRLRPVRAIFGGGWASYSRLATGLGLIVAAVGWWSVTTGELDAVGQIAGAGLLGVVGLAAVVGPWIFRLAADYSAERAERVRTQERADMAAHLHDSVLQTLALIQKNAADPGYVARVARAQERDLRSWLYAGEQIGAGTVASTLRGVAAELEDAYAVNVDVVNVGDCPMAEQLQPLIAAVREAVMNSAKHAGTGKVDVYTEVTGTGVDVFVRDRGAGFDPKSVAEDRMGVRNSIVDRMARHGGTAEIRSAAGEGTEVRLHMPRSSGPPGAGSTSEAEPRPRATRPPR
ncbi:MAG: ATP-binding protein [Nocardioides sp.]